MCTFPNSCNGPDVATASDILQQCAQEARGQHTLPVRADVFTPNINYRTDSTANHASTYQGVETNMPVLKRDAKNIDVCITK